MLAAGSARQPKQQEAASGPQPKKKRKNRDAGGAYESPMKKVKQESPMKKVKQEEAQMVSEGVGEQAKRKPGRPRKHPLSEDAPTTSKVRKGTHL